MNVSNGGECIRDRPTYAAATVAAKNADTTTSNRILGD